jgi:hypothetical protein
MWLRLRYIRGSICRIFPVDQKAPLGGHKHHTAY